MSSRSRARLAVVSATAIAAFVAGGVALAADPPIAPMAPRSKRALPAVRGHAPSFSEEPPWPRSRHVPTKAEVGVPVPRGSLLIQLEAGYPHWGFTTRLPEVGLATPVPLAKVVALYRRALLPRGYQVGSSTGPDGPVYVFAKGRWNLTPSNVPSVTVRRLHCYNFIKMYFTHTLCRHRHPYTHVTIFYPFPKAGHGKDGHGKHAHPKDGHGKKG